MVALKWILLIALALSVLVIVAGQLGLLSGKPPDDLGVKEGKLKRPSRTPNCVSSQAAMWPQDAALAAAIEPLRLGTLEASQASMAPLVKIVESMPGARVVTSRSDYVYVQFTTRLLKYVDDAEFWLDAPAGLIHVRSASRVGRKDFGVNRARIEAIRTRLASAAAPP